MTNPRLRPPVDWLRDSTDRRADRELLAAFVGGDEAAFAELVRRHGPMVLGVCERVLGSRDDAEDAYQSTFLALAEQAAKQGWRESVAGWLHNVAWRTATKMRVQWARRHAREQQATLPSPGEPAGEWPEVLDEEVRRLPEAMREAVLCCYFQGLTRRQAADKLGWSLRTLERRLEEGKRRLRERLEARGEPVPALLLGPGFSLPSCLGRWWLVAGLLLVCGGGLVALPGSSDPVPAPAAVKAAPPAAPQEPLPTGAIARLGETRFRHGSCIYHLALTTDGKVLASTGYERSVCLWDTATGKLLRDVIGGKRAGCRNLAFSPDGLRMIAAMHPLVVLDTNTGKAVHELKGHTDEHVVGVAWSDDGKWVASSCLDRTIRVWDAASGKQRHVITGYRYCTPEKLAFVPGSREFLTTNAEGFYLLDLDSGKERTLPVGKGNGVLALAYSRDGKRLVILRGDLQRARHRDDPKPPPAEICVWDVDGKAEPRVVLKANILGVSVTFTSDSRRLAVGGRDGSVRLLEVATGREIRRWNAHHGEVHGLVFSPDDQVLFTSGGDSVVRRWTTETGAEIAAAAGHATPVKGLRFRPDGKGLVSLDLNHQLIHWNLATRAPRPSKLPEQREKSPAVLSPDGRLVAAASDFDPNRRYEIGVYDARTGGRRRTLAGHVFSAIGLAFDHQGGRLVSFAYNDKLKLWDLMDGKCLWETAVPVIAAVYQPNSRPLHFSRDGRLLILGGYKTAAYLYDAATGQLLHRFEHATDQYAPAFAADFSPDGQLVALPNGWRDTAIVLLEARTGKVRRTWRSGQEGGFTAVEFSPDGRLLATAGSHDSSLKLWDVATGQEVATFPGQGRDTCSLAFSPDGRVLAAGGRDSTILLLDVTGRAGLPNKAMTPGRFRELWGHLADEDTKKVHAATWELALSGDGAVSLLRERVVPVKAADAAVIDRLVKQLGASEFPAREKATRELERLGASALPRLHKLRESGPDAEVRRRIDAVIEAFQRGDDWQRQRQALAVLERGGSSSARELVEELAGGATGAPLTEEARAVLGRMSPRR